MNELPFKIVVRDSSSGNKEESLTCLALLRVVSGKRDVYDALWNDQRVIVKIFSHAFCAKHHLKREWRGLSLLQERGLNSPKPLFCGRTRTGQWVIVAEKIADSSTVLDVFCNMQNCTDRLKLLNLMCREVARQHSKGVLQLDLHLGNFLLVGSDVFAIDPSQMRFYRRQVSRRKCISQLAVLSSYMAEDDTESIRAFYAEYARCRSWYFRESDQSAFAKYRNSHKKAYIRRRLKKSLRTSKRHFRIRSAKYLAVFERSFCDEAKASEFIGRIGSLMDSGRILRNDSTCSVSRLNWNGKDIVVKRRSSVGLVHSIVHSVMRSWARRRWLHANRLRMLRLPAPAPLAFIEERRWIFVLKSYLVTEFSGESNVSSFLEQQEANCPPISSHSSSEFEQYSGTLD